MTYIQKVEYINKHYLYNSTADVAKALNISIYEVRKIAKKYDLNRARHIESSIVVIRNKKIDYVTELEQLEKQLKYQKNVFLNYKKCNLELATNLKKRIEKTKTRINFVKNTIKKLTQASQ